MGRLIQFLDPGRLEKIYRSMSAPHQPAHDESEYWDRKTQDVMMALPLLSMGQRIVVAGALGGNTIRKIAEATYSTPDDISKLYGSAIKALRRYFKS